MGDVVSLVEKAQEQVTQDEAEQLQEKMAAGKLTLDDFLDQLRRIRKMGSMKTLLKMIPGVGKQLDALDLDDDQLNRTEAMVQSMTKDERGDVELLNQSRRRRIARGSGTRPEDISQLAKGFGMVSAMTRQMSGMGMMQRMRAMGQMGQADLTRLGRPGGAQLKVKQRSQRRRKDRKKRSR
jgi:signal recognition particle subunit SRP54